jgi:hypothetical protein
MWRNCQLAHGTNDWMPRGNQHQYLDVLAIFGRFGAANKSYKDHLRTHCYDAYVGVLLEAFVVQTYTNNYEIWKAGKPNKAGKKNREDFGGADTLIKIARTLEEQRADMAVTSRFSEKLRKKFD